MMQLVNPFDPADVSIDIEGMLQRFNLMFEHILLELPELPLHGNYLTSC